MVISSNGLNRLFDILDEASIYSWEDISAVVDQVEAVQLEPLPDTRWEFFQTISQSTTFLTFDFGIDGVSIEIAKYARALEALYQPAASAGQGDSDPEAFVVEHSGLHFIAGDFYPQADSVLGPSWHRFQIEGINGWSKWGEGRWFDALYFEDMPADSQRSSELAAEIFRQSTVIARRLGQYLEDIKTGLLIPVNVASNPGNLALTLALVFVTEALGTVVINSNHDFYWDGGKPAADRGPGEEPGPRDHFFRNIDNKPFFALFQRLYPWNGRRWLQLNINRRQSKSLVERYGFTKQRVLEISTCVGDEFFKDYTIEDVRSARRRMALILADGEEEIRSASLEAHRQRLEDWMEEQIPLVIGLRKSLRLDLMADDLIYLLQPTRVVARKRIERGVELIQALLQGPLSDTFEYNDRRQIVLHITGPTPLEHQADLETILFAFGDLKNNLPAAVAERVFLAFSAGREFHPVFEDYGLDALTIDDIYRLATVILFPSEIEGRGLPIIESAAVGVPIICSRYHPEDVFAHVVGEDLPAELRIRYLLFPEEDFSDEFLAEAAELMLLDPDVSTEWHEHNREAVQARYSRDALRASFRYVLDYAYETTRVSYRTY